MNFYSQPYFSLMESEPLKFQALYHDHLTKVHEKYINSINDNHDFTFLLFALLGDSIKNEDNDLYSTPVKEFLIKSLRTKKGPIITLNEKIYVDNLQAFELFVFESIKTLYWLYPQAIYEYINNWTIERLTNFLDEKKIEKNIISNMYNNILNVLDSYDKIFNLNLNLSKNLRNDLWLISNIRNQIVHNNGYVNNTFIQKLNNRKIDHNYNIGNFVLNDTTKIVYEAGSILNNIAHTLHISVENAICNLGIKYCKSKKDQD